LHVQGIDKRLQSLHHYHHGTRGLCGVWLRPPIMITPPASEMGRLVRLYFLHSSSS
jgi:hypothetical protein